MLVGRDTEIAALDGLLEAARTGRSGALLLRGEAGIGKTALLDHAVSTATGFEVLRATGIESEAELPYATLHQLLRPLADRIDRLADPQARALRGALGLADEGDVDRFLVGVGTLTLLADAAEEQPVVAVLDDAAWFDRASCDALAFAARRLHAEGLVLLFAVRDAPGRSFALPGVEELHVGRLADGDARRLLGNGVEPSRREDVLARAAGNPLALLELGRPEADGRAAGAEQAFAGRIADLPDATQALLLLAAADGTQSLAVIGAAARKLSLDATALEPAELEGLVLVADGAIEFRHPLVRSAAYRGASFARRARAHLALAGALEGEENADRRAWHRAAAVLGPDEQAADDLERTADRALLRGGHSAASAALARAAELTADVESRSRRLAAAADAAWLAGDTERALALVERVDSRDDGVCAITDYVHGLVAGQRGSSMESFDWFLRAARTGRLAAPRLALQAVTRAAMAAWESGRTEKVGELRAAAAAIPASSADEQSAAAFVEGSMAFVEQDYDQAMPAFGRAIEAGSGSSDAGTLLMASYAGAFLARIDESLLLARRAERLARSSAAIAALGSILRMTAAWSLASSQFTAAEDAASKGLAIARETGQTSEIAGCLSLLARVDAVRGREDACREHAGEALELARTHELLLAGSTAEFALGFLDLGAGRHEEALGRLGAVHRDGHVTTRTAFVDELVEAAVRAGRPDDALAPLAEWERFMGGRGVLIGDFILARGRAMLARPEDADEAFQACLAMNAGADWPLHQARTELAYGEFLRRARRKTEARAQLRAAYEGFQRIGAAAWADRAARELRATGETARRRDTSTLDDLTPQELQIARLVAQGGRNREIAGQLFLSPKTVEYHLRKVFQKLDIASRTELVKLVSSGDAPRELAGSV
jgi:DNA-binding CsgD family transcriptional regulator/tetratricopeptide (TPR) repeat protein